MSDRDKKLDEIGKELAKICPKQTGYIQFNFKEGYFINFNEYWTKPAVKNIPLSNVGVRII